MSTTFTFQERCVAWALKCFGYKDTMDPDLRAVRFIEEALELVQACGLTKEQVMRVFQYVYARPIGTVDQETGGVMVSLAVLCQARDTNMLTCAEMEFMRISENMEAIGKKHKEKPDFVNGDFAKHEAQIVTYLNKLQCGVCPFEGKHFSSLAKAACDVCTPKDKQT